MTRRMVLLVLVETDEPQPIDVDGAEVDELSQVVPCAKPFLAKCGELLEMAERRKVAK